MSDDDLKDDGESAYATTQVRKQHKKQGRLHPLEKNHSKEYAHCIKNNILNINDNLRIRNFYDFQNLSQLQFLYISGCPNLTLDGVQNVQSLKDLSITECNIPCLNMDHICSLNLSRLTITQSNTSSIINTYARNSTVQQVRLERNNISSLKFAQCFMKLEYLFILNQKNISIQLETTIQSLLLLHDLKHVEFRFFERLPQSWIDEIQHKKQVEKSAFEIKVQSMKIPPLIKKNRELVLRKLVLSKRNKVLKRALLDKVAAAQFLGKALEQAK